MSFSIDMKMVPFSIRESFLVISKMVNWPGIEDGIYIRSVKGGDDRVSRLFRLEVLEGEKPTEIKCVARPGLLTLNNDVEICIVDQELILLRGKSDRLKLTQIGGSYDHANRIGMAGWEVNSYSENTRAFLGCTKGKLEVSAPWGQKGCAEVTAVFGGEDDSVKSEESETREPETKGFEAFIRIGEVAVNSEKPAMQFNDAVEMIENDYYNWLKKTPGDSYDLSETRELAAYITWSAMVPAGGKLTRPAMYMSKNWMTNIWSWDHCFNAMALAQNQPVAAWDQIMLMMENQHESGVLPDFVNDRFTSWSCCKPPIHGWAISWMEERYEILSKNPERLQEIYPSLVKWTDFWLKVRGSTGSGKTGIPQYFHGNDSGWDNSTIFREGGPVESPDLMTYLILQVDLLEKLANMLNRKVEAVYWNEKSKWLLSTLMEEFWDGNRFVSYYIDWKDGERKKLESDSLILYIPLLLGDKLPAEVRNKLVQRVELEHLTEWGFATEKVRSEFYIPDGYWRGPIWAPSTMLLIDGLENCGEVELAKKAATRFCRMASRSGMAENYDGLTGEGLRDRAFTWTSSVFLILFDELVKNGCNFSEYALE